MAKKTLDEQIDEEIKREELNTTKEKHRIRYVASFPNLVDLVENENGDFEFLVFDPTSKKTTTTPTIEIDGKGYQPPPHSSLPKNLTFPRKEQVNHWIHEKNTTGYLEDHSISNHPHVGDDSDDIDDIDKVTIYKTSMWDVALYGDIIDYYKERAELPEEGLYDICALWAFHTYAVERANFSPIIYFLGLPEKGKSRMLKAMTYIARRGIRKISLTDAQILRDCTHLDATLAMDMMNLWKKIDLAGSEDVFLNRPERGIDVSRVNRPDKGAFLDTDYYTVFGPTIFATNELIDEILETRAIPIIMKKAKKEYNNEVNASGGLEIKEKLTAWRACTMGDAWPEFGRIAQSRLGDITKPLYQLIQMINPAREEDFKKTIAAIAERRIKEKADNFSGQILQSLIRSRELVEHGYLKSQKITDEFNKDKTDREKLSSRRILNRLKTMGFESVTAHGGSMAIIWNQELIDALINEFGLEALINDDILSPSSKSSTSSPTSLSQRELYYADLAEKE